MEELRHDLPLHRRSARKRGLPKAAPPRSRLAEMLIEARCDKGLELRDVSVITGVRMSQLEALEAGDHPPSEDAKGKTAVRRYARAVGLDPARMLLIYAQERRGVYAAPPPELELPSDDARTPAPLWGRIGRTLATLTLVVATLGGALWAFNTLVFPPVSPPALGSLQSGTLQADTSGAVTPNQTSPQAGALGQSVGQDVGQSAGRGVALPLRGLPPSLSVDLSTAQVPVRPLPTPNPRPSAVVGTPGTSLPSANRPSAPATAPTEAAEAPISAAASEVLPVPTDEGTRAISEPPETAPEPIEAAPLAAAPSDVPGEAASTPPTTAPVPAEPAGGAGDLTLRVEQAAWLEVYTGGARREGERLVYRIAEAGEVLSFELPVFIFTGNAGGVAVSVAEEPGETLGLPGAVVGRAFSE